MIKYCASFLIVKSGMKILLSGIFISLSFSLTLAQSTGNIESFLHNEGRIILENQEYSQRLTANDTFLVTLKNYIATKDGFDDPLNSVNNMMRLAPGKDVRIYTWQMPDSNFHYIKYGLIAAKTRHGIQVTELQDQSDKINEAQFQILKPDNWYGAIYYKAIPVKKGHQILYTLLGYAPGQSLNQKIIEVLDLDHRGRPRFGARIFHIDQFMDKTLHKPPMRLILSYSSEYSASVRWNDEKKMIIMDHLSPPDVKLKGVYRMYGPDMSYDGLEWKDNWWYLQEQVKFDSRQNIKLIPPDKPIGLPPGSNSPKPATPKR